MLQPTLDGAHKLISVDPFQSQMNSGFPGNSGFGTGGGWTPRRRRPTTPAGMLVSAVVFIVALVIIIATFHHSQSHGGSGGSDGVCVGGPATGAAGTPIGHGNYRFPCSGGGSTIVHIGN